MKYLPLLLPLAALLGLSQCKKNTPAPADQLPPATQTGTNTFGCLVNGQVWTPQGYNGTSNYSVSYDPNYRKGTLNIGTYRYDAKDPNSLQSIVLYSDSLLSKGQYLLNKPAHQEAVFSDSKSGCQFEGFGKNYCRGTLTITRLDLQAGVIAGTFAFTLYKPGCDSVRVTQGRFDKKL